MELGPRIDTRLKWPYRLLMAGPSSSGKSTLMKKLVLNPEESMTRIPTRVELFYSHNQDAYTELVEKSSCQVILHEGAPDMNFSTPPGTLVIVDDLQGRHADVISSWFTRKCHHMDSSIIYLIQNIFDKTPQNRTISLNSSYIILFKNPRDASQVRHLDKQIYPGGGGLLTRAYRYVTKERPYAYIVIDFNQSTPEEYRLRSTLFPRDDFPNAWIFQSDN